VLREDAFAFFNTSREIALLVKFGEVEEPLITGGSSHRMCCNALPGCLKNVEESN
jgi:hypothetical protein